MVFTILVFLLVFRVTVLKCEMTSYSAFSCALNRNSVYPRFQDVASKISEATNPQAARSADGYVFFYLYTRENPEGQVIGLNDEVLLSKSSFNKSRPTKFVTHGYTSSKDSAPCTLPRDAFLQSGDYNVIVIDWYEMQKLWGIILLDYWTVCGYVKEVGLYVASMIDFLEDRGLNLDTTTLIGHSLGAHIVGVAGYFTKNTVNYIVGLDPALPAFEERSHDERLSIHDAKLVEVIHTNSGECGEPQQIGHYDFFPNGGYMQPGCSKNTCSHSRAYHLYAESITNENGFYARKCPDYDAVKEGNCFGHVMRMGGRATDKLISKTGMYYLKTRESSPYALEISRELYKYRKNT